MIILWFPHHLTLTTSPLLTKTIKPKSRSVNLIYLNYIASSKTSSSTRTMKLSSRNPMYTSTCFPKPITSLNLSSNAKLVTLKTREPMWPSMVRVYSQSSLSQITKCCRSMRMIPLFLSQWNPWMNYIRSLPFLRDPRFWKSFYLKMSTSQKIIHHIAPPLSHTNLIKPFPYSSVYWGIIWMNG